MKNDPTFESIIFYEKLSRITQYLNEDFALFVFECFENSDVSTENKKPYEFICECLKIYIEKKESK